MATTFHGWAARHPGALLEPYEFEPAPLGPHDVEVEITHCGICHSDLHLVDGDWEVDNWPLVPGHEIVGHVVQAGSAVTEHALGDRVGIGWQCGACLACEWCLAGDEPFCPEHRATCVGRPGGFADRIRVDARFAFPLPEALPSETVGPLMCGGATVWTPLREHGIDATSRVAVVGIGGLGHLAVRFAAALGARVTAISHSADKEELARELGADEFLVLGEETLRGAARAFDLVLVTVPVALDWPALARTVRPRGRMAFVGVVPGEVGVPVDALILGNRGLVGSQIAGRARMREMLAFAAERGIAAMVETFPMEEVNVALDRLRRNELRFRAVLTR